METEREPQGCRPGAAAGGILAAVFAACISVPLVMYRQMEKRSVTQRTAVE